MDHEVPVTQNEDAAAAHGVISETQNLDMRPDDF